MQVEYNGFVIVSTDEHPIIGISGIYRHNTEPFHIKWSFDVFFPAIKITLYSPIIDELGDHALKQSEYKRIFDCRWFVKEELLREAKKVGDPQQCQIF